MTSDVYIETDSLPLLKQVKCFYFRVIFYDTEDLLSSSTYILLIVVSLSKINMLIIVFEGNNKCLDV